MNASSDDGECPTSSTRSEANIEDEKAEPELTPSPAPQPHTDSNRDETTSSGKSESGDCGVVQCQVECSSTKSGCSYQKRNWLQR